MKMVLKHNKRINAERHSAGRSMSSGYAGVITHEGSNREMKTVMLTVAIILCIATTSYFGYVAINKHIDQESGTIVERILSDNTIAQLELLTDVQDLIQSGNIESANRMLLEATDTSMYILKNNCELSKCKEALREYENTKKL